MAKAQSDSFLLRQLQMERVKTAFKKNESLVKKKLALVGARIVPEIFIRAFKQEKLLQVFVKNGTGKFVRYDNFKICAASGKPGPKKKQGDQQVPEGFYHIAVFNPVSKFHLSLGINYPNEADQRKYKASDKGGDIYIHGECASIGCLAMNEKIEEIYVLAVMAHAAGQEKIPVHIFPFRMSEKNFDQYVNPKSKLQPFWKNLQQGFLFFENKKRVPLVSVDEKGFYLLE